MKIGNVLLENNVFLAPMAGVTDLPFRILCREQGCGLVYSEMVSAKGIFYGNENTNKLLWLDEKERPVAIQIFGRDPDIMGRMARKLDDYHFDILDINMGCPAPKIVKNLEGSALLKEPKLIGQIIKSVCLNTKKPVTIKIRKGFDDSSINAVEISKIAEDNGAKAVAVHGRTREQYYRGSADWDIIYKVKNSVSIPVIGNGDIFTPIDAKNIIEQTGCDGVMIGRRAMGNPFIFNQMTHYLKTGILLKDASLEEKISMAIRHTNMLIDFKGEYIAIREMRKHISDYTKGFNHSAKLRAEINKIDNKKDLINTLINAIDFS